MTKNTNIHTWHQRDSKNTLNPYKPSFLLVGHGQERDTHTHNFTHKNSTHKNSLTGLCSTRGVIVEMTNNKGAGKTVQRRINRFDQIIVCNSCWLFASFCLSSKIKVIMVTMFG